MRMKTCISEMILVSKFLSPRSRHVIIKSVFCLNHTNKFSHVILNFELYKKENEKKKKKN